MFRFSAALILLTCLTSAASAQEPIQIENTYHIEVRVEHWRIGNPNWSTEFSTTDYNQAILVFELFDLALEENLLREMLGWSWEWLITDIRLRIEYSSQLTAPIQQSRITDRDRRLFGYQPPTYGRPHQ